MEDAVATTEKQTQDEQLRWLNSLLTSAQKRRWYGKITIDIKCGRIDLVKSEESLKPPRG